MNHQATKSPSAFNPDSEQDKVARDIVDCAFQVHTAMGCGLLESVYEDCMKIALKKKGLQFETQKPVLLNFMGEKLDTSFRLDMIVENKVIVEIKAANANPVYQAQLLSYMKLANIDLGLLINFHVPKIKDGIKRMTLNNLVSW